MRYELRDYQRDAALEVLKRIRRGRRDWRVDGERSSFALSAITGSGKTVIATAVIEALLFGSTDVDTDVDPRISFLWITDDPALNRQTRGRMFDASELLAPTTLVEVDESFLDADLAPGRVFFLNTQKLSRSSRLVQSSTNAREFSFWDILRNTIRGDTTDLVLVLSLIHISEPTRLGMISYAVFCLKKKKKQKKYAMSPQQFYSKKVAHQSMMIQE